MSLEEEVLTLVAATEDQADFITGEGTAGGQQEDRSCCRRRKSDLNWAGVHIAHINAHCRKKQAMCPPCTEQNFYGSCYSAFFAAILNFFQLFCICFSSLPDPTY